MTRHHRACVTGVDRIEYDFNVKEGRLFMPPHCCCDMEGCIETFMKIDDKVQLILTFAGHVPATVYQRKEQMESNP